MNELALFAGAGGGLLGTHLLGFKPVCAVEFDHYARSVLLARQNDRLLPAFPVWDDVRTFDGHAWRGVVELVSGGFPCQDISAAGAGAGIDGKRSGLWGEMARIIREVGPHYVFVENSPMLTSRGLGTVLGDLAEMGFDAEWCVLGAHHAGAAHERERIWILAHSQGERRGARRPWRPDSSGQGERKQPLSYVSDAYRQQHEGKPYARLGQGQGAGASLLWRDWPAEPQVDRVAYGVANGVDQIRCIGNGQVPRVAAAAFIELASRFE